MWIPLVEKEFDLNLVQLRDDGSFHIPVIKKTISNAPFEIKLMEYSVNFKKTDRGNELHISRKGLLAKRLRFDGEWARYQENEERQPNRSTPVPGAPRKQLSLPDEKTMEMMWSENFKFRLRAYSFLQSKWDEADEFGVHVPNRQGHRRIAPLLYGGLLPFIVACVFYFVVSNKIDVKQIKEQNRIALEQTVADARTANNQAVDDNKNLLEKLKQTNSDPSSNSTTNPNESSSTNPQQSDKPGTPVSNLESDSQSKVIENADDAKPKVDNSKSSIVAKPEKKEKAKEIEVPKKMEPVMPPPSASWTMKKTVSDLELGEYFKIGLKITPNGKIPARLFYHFGPWKEGNSKLIEFRNEGNFEVRLDEDVLTDIKMDSDGFVRGTVTLQVLVTNNESPYEDENETKLKESYRSSILFRENEAVRVFMNRRPVFRSGESVAKVDSGPIQNERLGRRIIVQGGKESFIQPKATDPEGENHESLVYEYKEGNEWVLAKKNQVPVATTKSGKYSVTVRARDKAKRVSKEETIEYAVNFPPKIKLFSTKPSWPVPGGPLRILVNAVDQENDDLVIQLKLISNGKVIRPKLLNYFDSDEEKPVGENSVLYQYPKIDEGTAKVEVLIEDDRRAVADTIYRDIEIRSPKTMKPSKPGRRLTNSLGLDFVEIPPGEFVMGSPVGESGRKEYEILHGVKITKPFFLQTIEFPKKLRNKLIADDGRGKNMTTPSSQLKYADAQYIATILNRLPEEAKAGRFYRLPTEAEWEYACRAGSSAPFNVAKENGRFLTIQHANISANYSSSPKPPKQYKPNAFGLYDMHGNVNEICSDEFNPDYYWNSPVENPKNPPVIPLKSKMVVRGGGSYESWQMARSASRRSGDRRSQFGGLRLACEIRSPRKVGSFNFKMEPDKTFWKWDRTVWDFESDGLSIMKRKESSIVSTLISEFDVTDFEFTCDVTIGKVKRRNGEITPSTTLEFVPRGTLYVDNPPKFSYMAYRVIMGNRKWGTVTNTDGRGGTTFQIKEEVSQKLQQTIRVGGSNSLKIRCEGNNVTVWINNIQVGSNQVKDMPAKGRFGILINQRKYEAGNVEIQNPTFKKIK